MTALALDLSRMLAGLLRRAPRGIDRIEMLYARHLLDAWPGPCFALQRTPWGPRLYNRDHARRGVAAMEAQWGENGGDQTGLWRAMPKHLKVGVTPGRDTGDLPPGSIYLNVGHLGLAFDQAWLRARPDIHPVFMLHDLIPLQHPQQVRPREAAYFSRILDSLPLAHGLILNSQSVARTVEHDLPKVTCPKLIAPLPVPPVFLQALVAPDTPHEPYFIALGQVERRKNLDILIEVWRLWALEGPPPTLLLAGARGDAAQAIDAQIAACGLDRIVRRIESPPSAKLPALLRGATALLAPSLVEGFGLPVAEALTVGAPVVASDIPAHREVGGAHARFVDPKDPQAWLAVLRPLIHDPASRAALRLQTQGYRPRTTGDYFRQVEAFLTDLANA
jgi:glycosyltransferase involved in cell wall biosynthesis